MNRRSKKGKEVGVNQSISVLEAIQAYTWGGAYASFEENVKGTLEAEKWADLVLLNRSILSCPHEELKDIKVDMTVLNGEIVHVNYKEDAL